MDILQEAAKAFRKLIETEYHITVGKSGKLFSYILQFSPYDFKHIAGLHKLSDLGNIKRSSSKKLFKDITAPVPRLSLADIQNSSFYSVVENRIKNLILLESYLDSADVFYNWDVSRSPFSKIEADLMIPAKSALKDGETAYAFFKSYDGNNLKIVDYFTEPAELARLVTLISDEKDYRSGQSRPSTLLYKAKINKTTGEKTVFIDKLIEEKASTKKETSVSSQSTQHSSLTNNGNQKNNIKKSVIIQNNSSAVAVPRPLFADLANNIEKYIGKFGDFYNWLAETAIKGLNWLVGVENKPKVENKSSCTSEKPRSTPEAKKSCIESKKSRSSVIEFLENSKKLGNITYENKDIEQSRQSEIDEKSTKKEKIRVRIFLFKLPN